MRGRVALFVAALGLAGCSLIFDGSAYEERADGGMDAGADAGGRECDFARDDCCDWTDCTGGFGQFCVYDEDADSRSCAVECEEDADCALFFAGTSCVREPDGFMGCGCVDDSDCVDPTLPYCGELMPVCVGCQSDGDCDGGDVCRDGFCFIGCDAGSPCPSPEESCIDDVCVFCDADGDGFSADDVCSPGEPLDCDDGDRSIHPGADPLCGSGVFEDCDADLYRPLIDSLGADADVGVQKIIEIERGLPADFDSLDVSVGMDDIIVVVGSQGGEARIWIAEPDLPIMLVTAPSEVPCASAPTSFTNVQRVATSAAARGLGQHFVALAGRTADGGQAVVVIDDKI